MVQRALRGLETALRSLALCLAAALGAGCSSTVASDDGGAIRDVGPRFDVGFCRQPELASVSECAPTLAQTHELWAQGIDPATCVIHQGKCGAYQVFIVVSEGSVTCTFDEKGTTLLRAMACSDTPAYCDGAAACKTAGADIDVDLSCDVLALPCAKR